jgi:hypothetical protein
VDTGPRLEAMVAFARAWETEGIDLRGVEVCLPEGDWHGEPPQIGMRERSRN